MNMSAKMGGPKPRTIVPETVVASSALASPRSGSSPATASTIMITRPIVRCLPNGFRPQILHHYEM